MFRGVLTVEDLVVKMLMRVGFVELSWDHRMSFYFVDNNNAVVTTEANYFQCEHLFGKPGNELIPDTPGELRFTEDVTVDADLLQKFLARNVTMALHVANGRMKGIRLTFFGSRSEQVYFVRVQSNEQDIVIWLRELLKSQL